MKNINFKDRTVIGFLIAFVTFFVLAIGASVSYFTIKVQGNDNAKDITTNTGTLELTYIDGPEIRMEGTYPGQHVTKTVHVTNTGTNKVSYAIGLVDYVNTFFNNEFVVSYTCTSYENYGGSTQTESGTCQGFPETAMTSESSVIDEGIQIGVGITHEITLTFKFKETGSNQNSNQGQTFAGKLNVEESADSFNLVMKILDSSNNPIANATVEVHSVLKTGTTDENGKVTILNVPAGAHNIKVIDSNNNEVINDSIMLVSLKSSLKTNVVSGKTVTANSDIEKVKFSITQGSENKIDSLGGPEAAYDSIKAEGLTTLAEISQAATGQQNYATVEYRFQGASADVNNWVYFNCSNQNDTSTCEKWRIIGLFQTEDGGDYHLKIIRDNRIDGGTSSYDGWYWNRVQASGKQYNDWSAAQLQYYLNSTTSSSFNLTGTATNYNGYLGTLSSTSQNMIYETKWYLGAAYYSSTTANAYTNERSDSVYSTNPTNWTGKIGLIYPSDYGYASSSCYNTTTTLYSYNSSDCKNSNWLFNSYHQWTISPYSSSVIYITSSGYASYSGSPSNRYIIRPVTYLKSSVSIDSGLGTEESPWMLEM